MRASDADRDIVLRTLADAYAEGRLDPVEYDERADAVTSAKTLGELPVVLEDLVPMTAPVLRRRCSTPAASRSWLSRSGRSRGATPSWAS